MAYQSLYRKYRPQTFADVVGQGHVTRTLQNALESGRVSHGYLFTGTRGTAKTTVARLLAKALNCESSDRPVREPCNKCGACTAITSGAAIDVIEMDAASHRGVADIEEVRRSVSFGPMELRYKVFIIDEAHQLSSDAKDAFLKTLEEPPANVVFILATTEPQSIPITIRSRCQQFDFKRGSIGDITGRLRYVLDCEGVAYTPEAVTHVARGAEGSYRDSLSLLEQVLAFSPKSIATSDVDTVLGTLDREMLRRVTSAVATRNAPEAFALAGELLDAGKEARTLLRTLSLHFRDLLLVSVGGPAVGQELTPEEITPLQVEARSFQPAEMIRAMEILNEAQGETRWNNQHRLLVELTFLKLMNLGDARASQGLSTAPIVFQEQRPVNYVPPPAIPTQPVAPTRPAVEAPPVTRTPVVAQPYVAPVALPTPVNVVAKTDDDEDDFSLDGTTDATTDSEDEDTTTSTPAYLDDDRAADSDDEDEEPIDTLTGNLFGDAPEAIPVVEPVVPQTPVAPVAPVANVPAPPAIEPAAAGLTIDDVLHCWPAFLRKAASVSKMTETMMLQSRPEAVRNGIVEITFKNASPFDMMNQPKQQEFVRKALARCLGVERVGVRFSLEEGAVPPPAPPTPKNKRRERDAVAALDELDDEGPSFRPDNGFGIGAAPVDDFGYGMPVPPPAPTPRVSEPPRTASPPPAAEPPAPRQPTPERTAPPPQAANAGNGVNGTNGSGAARKDDAPAHRNGASRVNQSLKDDPLVQEVLSTFGGEIVEE